MISTVVVSSVISIGFVLIAIAAVASIKTLVPLRERGHWGRAHLVPNAAITGITFATNLFLNVGLVIALEWLASTHRGLLNIVNLPPAMAVAIAVLALDFAYYLCHRALHAFPSWWRFHSVHHSDPFVDVTTTIRQHPGESLIRYGFLAAFAIALGASSATFGVYRLWSVLAGLAEHANVRLPLWLDRALVLFVSTPNMHKVHHSRLPTQTDSNYSTVTSVWDRIFCTYTPSTQGTAISYGLSGYDDPAMQTTLGLLALPFEHPPTAVPNELTLG